MNYRIQLSIGETGTLLALCNAMIDQIPKPTKFMQIAQAALANPEPEQVLHNGEAVLVRTQREIESILQCASNYEQASIMMLEKHPEAFKSTEDREEAVVEVANLQAIRIKLLEQLERQGWRPPNE